MGISSCLIANDIVSSDYNIFWIITMALRLIRQIIWRRVHQLAVDWQYKVLCEILGAINVNEEEVKDGNRHWHNNEESNIYQLT